MDYVQMAQAAGLPPELAAYAPRYVQIESGGNPNAQTGSYSGLLQMGPDEIAKYGSNGADAGLRMYADNNKWFTNKFGRSPSPTELYLTAQQGQGGITNHLADPGAPAWVNMFKTGEGQQKGAGWAKKAIWGNVPDDMKSQFGSVDNVTSQDFLNLWQHKVERSPMNVAFHADQQQQQGKPMADPSLSSRVLAGGPGALFGAPSGVFPGADGSEGGGYDLGQALSRAGASIMSIANPAGGAAMMNAVNMPLFRQRYSIVTDKLGRQYRLDIHTGAVTPLTPGATAPGGAASGGAPAAGAPQTADEMNYQSPVAQEQAVKSQVESDQKKYDEIQDLGGQAQALIDQIDKQVMPLSKNPNVYQGSGADLALEGKKALAAGAKLFGFEGPKGVAESADLQKQNADLQAKFLAAQKGVRFAGPEIKFSGMANADIDKPAETNQQIYSNMRQQASRAVYAAQLARQYKAAGLPLGSRYHEELKQYYDANPIYQPDQLSGGASGASGRPPLSSFNR